MQYYRGSALQEEVEAKEVMEERRQPFILRVGKVFLFPFALIFWVLQDAVHKSVEDPD